MTAWLPKALISLGALGLATVRIFYPDLPIDTATLGLIVVALLPWLSTLIKSVEVPGGWKVEFQDIQSAGAKVIQSLPAQKAAATTPRPSYVEISDHDPNLALVGLRIELEKRLRALAERYGVREKRSLIQTFDELRRRRVLNDHVISGLRELVLAGNQAAHGASVDPRAAAWAMDYGPQVLGVLDRILEEESGCS